MALPAALLAALWLTLSFGAGSKAGSAPTLDEDLAAVRHFQQQRSWVPAESLAAVVLARLSSDPAADSLRIADMLFAIGQARCFRLNLSDGKALQATGRCLEIRQRELGAEHVDVAEAHVLLGRVFSNTGGNDSALVHYQKAREICTSLLGPADTLVANTWGYSGLAHRGLRDFRRALEELGQALSIREHYHGPVHRAVAEMLAQMGYCWHQLGDLDHAREALERSLSVLGKTVGRDARQRILPLDYLAGVETAAGNHAWALDLSQEALRVSRLHGSEDDPEVIRMRGNLAAALFMFGDYAGMRAELQTVLPWYESHRGPRDRWTASTRLNLGLACAGVGDSSAAMRLLRKVETDLAAQPGPPDPNLAYALAWQARVLHTSGDDAGARAACERGLRTARAAPNPSAFTLALLHYTLLEVLCASADSAALDSTCRSLDRLADEFSLHTTTTAASISYWDARVAQKLGRDSQAWTHALEAFRRSHQQVCWNVQALPDGRALQLSWEQSRNLDVVVDLARNGSPQRLEAAWDRLVRTRGLVRAELARRRLPLALRSDPKIVAARAQWLKSQRSYAQRVVLTAGAADDSAETAKLERLRSLAEVTERAYVQALAGRRAAAVPAEVALSDVRARLRAGQALVSVIEIAAPTDTARVLAFVARGGGKDISLVDLGRTRELRAVLDAWQEQLAAPPGPDVRAAGEAERACRALGRAARTATWDRIAGLLGGAKDVFVVADGPLLDMPWQALPDKDGGYLVEAEPRLHVLNAEWELVAPHEPVTSTSMLAVGDPQYESAGEQPQIAAAPVIAAATVLAAAPVIAAATVRAASDPCSGGADLVLAQLPASGREAQEAARAWCAGGSHRTATLLVGQDATEAAVKREAPGRAILHLATHGIVARDTCLTGDVGTRGVGGVSPVSDAPQSAAAARARPFTMPAIGVGPSPWSDRRVWLALAGANHAHEHSADENEGLLTAEEVITLDLEGTDWVVLSACHAALAGALPREGTLGLRRAFHLAGARTVIASRWAVEDAATREWMRALYEARRAGAVGAAQAMQSASRAVLRARRDEGRSTHPFYWAAFTATGE